jgi:hypothetical protein
MPTLWKSYAAQTGLIYQYYFVGQRAALADDPDAPSTEYIFDATTDRKTIFAVSVFLPPSALAHWAAAHNRQLTEPEQYAGAKLRLLQAFDERSDMIREGRRVRLEGEMLVELLDSIGVD